MAHVLRTFWRTSAVNKLIQNPRIHLSNTASAAVTEVPDHGGISLLQPDAALPASGAELLASVQSQLPQLNAQQLLYALRKLAVLNYDVKCSDPTFQSLCGAFAKRARALQTHQLVEAARALARLRMPVDSHPVAITLQLLRCQLDQLDVRQITRLDYFVRRFNLSARSHLADALQEALPLAFSTRLPLEFDPDDPRFLGEALLYACSRAPHPLCIKQLVGALLTYRDLDSRLTANVLVALCDVNCDEKTHPDRARLLRVCGNRLTNLSDLGYNEVARLASAIGRRLRAPHVEYYHEKLVDAIGQYAINCKKLWQALKLAQTIWAARHVHRSLATHLSELAEREGETVLNTLWPFNLLVLVECLADAQITVHADVLKQLAIASFQGRPGDWIRLTIGLVALGHRDDTLIERALSPSALQHAGGDRARALAQWEQAALVGGGDRPREECTPLILAELARELGGAEFVARDVRLSDGVVADGVVCVAEGRALVMESKAGEELNPPSGALLICVLVLPEEWYSRNGHQARAAAQITEAAARGAGRAVLTVIAEKWARTVPRERGPHLAQALREVCADHGVSLLLL